jgi:murein DD-endopeptidase MepM/ murein hydrolase activator NlpD
MLEINKNKGSFLAILMVCLFIFTFNKCSDNKVQQNNMTCLERAKFGNPDSSEYVLPFPVGKRYVCSQSYCNPNGGHSNQLAYDFALQIGDTVVASRTGVVKELRENQPDNNDNTSSNLYNYLMIEHDDGTVAFYAHLKQNSVIVQVGDKVNKGNFIALSGNSGYTANFPHLHFGVYKSYPPVETYDVPVNFKNADGPLTVNNGLIADEWYEAKKY